MPLKNIKSVIHSLSLKSLISSSPAFSSHLYLHPVNGREVILPSNQLYLYQDVISDEEGRELVSRIEQRLKRTRYQSNHWDHVIVNYKEIELIEEIERDHIVKDIYQRMKDIINESLQKEYDYIPPHVIDLHKTGVIEPHVDSIKFSGELIAGLSLLSTRIMRLTLEKEHHELIEKKNYPATIDILLKPNSMYIMAHDIRYLYSHAVLGSSDTTNHPSPTFSQISIDRRISIMVRDALKVSPPSSSSS